MQGGGSFSHGGGGGGHHDGHRNSFDMRDRYDGYHGHGRYDGHGYDNSHNGHPVPIASGNDNWECCCCCCGSEKDKCNYKLAIGCQAFWICLFALVAGLVVKFAFYNGGNFDLAKGDQKLISTGVSAHFCESVTVESLANVDATSYTYFFDKNPQITSTDMINQNFTAILNVPTNDVYKYFAYNLLKGTVVNLRICSITTHTFYLVHGDANLKRFSNVDDCGAGCYIATTTFAFQSQPLCKDKFATHYTYVADQTDIYYHIVTGMGDAEYSFQMQRTYYDLRAGFFVATSPSQIDFPSWTQQRYVVINYPASAGSDTGRFQVTCNSRIGAYLVYFLGIPLLLVFTFAGIICLVNRRQTKT